MIIPKKQWNYIFTVYFVTHWEVPNPTCMSWNSLYKQATYKVLTLRRENADPNKGVAFR